MLLLPFFLLAKMLAKLVLLLLAFRHMCSLALCYAQKYIFLSFAFSIFSAEEFLVIAV